MEISGLHLMFVDAALAFDACEVSQMHMKDHLLVGGKI